MSMYKDTSTSQKILKTNNNSEYLQNYCTSELR